MKVLLTGASGFVGSHVLDLLRAGGVDVAVLLRPTSNREFIKRNLDLVEVRTGSVLEPSSLKPALEGVTHVVHCAGAVKALSPAEFFEVNQVGTRNLVRAFNESPSTARLVHISSLAAFGPSLPEAPANESRSECPVSVYGKSKLAGELEVRNGCQKDYVILRPPGVYGPRDREFLRLFKAIKHHLRPIPTAQPLSLVFVEDLARAAGKCLEAIGLRRGVYFVAHPQVVSAAQMGVLIAKAMSAWTVGFPLPTPLLWPLCLAQEVASKMSGAANVLSLQKYAELRAPGWVCDASLMRRELGFRCETSLEEGITRSLEWYRRNQWL